MFWAIGRWSALAAVPLLLLWLVIQPSRALAVLWYAIIPILPATFLLSARIWRGVCPLATLNELGNLLGRQRALTARMSLGLGVAGLALFHIMVPARHFLFNQNGVVLAVTIVAVGGLAAGLGSVFTVRSGFCNALCPVLPIEQLYGQSPLIRLERGRCSACVMCTRTGCLDLTEKVIPQMLGPARRSARWLATPHGVFFGALPGFIIGYNLVKDGPLSGAATVYATTLGWSLASYLIVGAAVLMLRLGSRVALGLIAAVAAGIYYWYAGPSIAIHLAAANWWGTGIRAAGMGLAALWLVRALATGTDSSRRRAITPGGAQPLQY